MKIYRKDNNNILDLRNKSGLDFSGSSFVTNSYQETEKLGYDFSQILQPGNVVSLIGDLGSGKTTFTKGLAKGLGIEKRIISPTFVLIRRYNTNPHLLKYRHPEHFNRHTELVSEPVLNSIQESNGIRNDRVEKLFHVDLYRLGDEDIDGLGLKEIISSEGAVTVIEWPEKAEHILPQNRWEIRFQIVDEEKRMIQVEKNNRNDRVPR